ncbi:MAG: hypothetical protein IJ801_02625 [Lachnospiraceae bacterium]|nr:hypothetical protein [Lachnospiraceae bacterium]
MLEEPLPFDTKLYDTLPVSVFICKPMEGEHEKIDFQIVHANKVFDRNWNSRGRDTHYIGAKLVENHVVDEDTASRMRECLTEPHSITAYMLFANLHVRFEPVELPCKDYLGFLIIHLTDKEEMDARIRFLHNIRQLGNIAILIRQHEDGRLESVYVSPEYAEMMEDTVEHSLIQMDGAHYKDTTHADDRHLVAHMLKYHEAPDHGPNIQIRKITAKGHIVWTNVRYAFFDYLEEHYIYITYYDITVLKGYEEKLKTSYENIGQSYYREDEKTLSMFRVDIDRDLVEEVGGQRPV